MLVNYHLSDKGAICGANDISQNLEDIAALNPVRSAMDAELQSRKQERMGFTAETRSTQRFYFPETPLRPRRLCGKYFLVSR
jgi:hypothetical protein